jgi:hypothetical protein
MRCLTGFSTNTSGIGMSPVGFACDPVESQYVDRFKQIWIAGLYAGAVLAAPLALLAAILALLRPRQTYLHGRK